MKKLVNKKLLNIYSEMQECFVCDEPGEMSCNVKKSYTESHGKLIGWSNDKEPNVILLFQNPSHHRYKTNKPMTEGQCQGFPELLDDLGMKFFITNALKCSTPQNRPPKTGEFENCLEYFIKELDVIKPKLIIACGSSPKKFMRLEEIIKYCNDNEIEIETAYHPNYCYSYHRISEEDYIETFKEIMERNSL